MSFSPSKRSLSPLPGPPLKRAKTFHSSPSSHRTRPCPAARLSVSLDQISRPLTSCASNEVCELDLRVSGFQPQSILSSATSRYHNLPHVAHLTEAFDTSIDQPTVNATRRDDYISFQCPQASTTSNPSSSDFLDDLEQMNFHFGSHPAHLPFFDGHPVSSNKSALLTHFQAPCRDGDFPDPMSGMYDGTDFPQDTHLFPSYMQSLSPLWDFNLDITPPNPSSPVSRSMSRSSFTSSSITDSCSPFPDCSTPASDNTITTPAPSEACASFPPDFSQDVFANHFPFDLAAKTKAEHDLSYVPGSAPLSPNERFTLDLSRIPQPVPSATPSRLAEARRHSGPANVAALHFAPFFASSLHEVLPQIAPVPADFMSMALPIMDNLASTSASGSHSALPSSIAPHQTQLPRPLELKHPKPVRGFKPPILLSGEQYDPNDFVRRRSAPVLPLPDLDVASHLSPDVSPEPDEEDDSMEYEEGAYEDDGCEDDSVDPSLFEGMDMESWLGMNQDGLFDPSWSWFQQGVEGSSSGSPQLLGEMFSQEIDWTLAGNQFPPVPPGIGSGTIPLDSFFGPN